MHPVLKHIDPVSIVGLQTRTQNRLEADPDTARILELWARFFAEDIIADIPDRAPDSPLYGVYSNYAAGQDGEYDITIGVAVTDSTAPTPGLHRIDIEAGTYLVFSAEGEIPMVTLATWGIIWEYFDSTTEYRRRFTTDFELYTGPEEVAIYIAVDSLS